MVMYISNGFVPFFCTVPERQNKIQTSYLHMSVRFLILGVWYGATVSVNIFGLQ